MNAARAPAARAPALVAWVVHAAGVRVARKEARRGACADAEPGVALSGADDGGELIGPVGKALLAPRARRVAPRGPRLDQVAVGLGARAAPADLIARTA